MLVPSGPFLARNLHLLILDDDPLEAELLRDAVSQIGIAIDLQIVTNLEKTTCFLDDTQTYVSAVWPDLILLNYRTPARVGEVLELVKGELTLRHIPVIALCHNPTEEHIQTVYNGHVNCCIVRPLLRQNLDGVLKIMLQFWTQTAVVLRTRPA